MFNLFFIFQFRYWPYTLIDFLNKLFEYLRILSLDVALGGVVLTNSIAQAFGVRLPFSVSLGLFLAIWLIYSFDHLIDAQKLKQRASMKRHQFHYEHRKAILRVMIFLTLLGVANMMFLPMVTLFYGLIMIVLVTFYFFISWRLNVLLIKEVFIASIYATGVFIGPVSLGASGLVLIGVFLFQLFALALLNLLLISNYEVVKDVEDGQSSWAVRFGERQTQSHIQRIFGVLALAQLTSAYWFQSFFWFQILLLIMTLVLWMVFHFREYFMANERYRIIGDFVFFIPGLIFWF